MAYNWCICGHTKGQHKKVDNDQNFLCYYCDAYYMTYGYYAGYEISSQEEFDSFNNEFKERWGCDYVRPTFCNEFKLDNLRFVELKSKAQEKKCS